MYTAYTGMSRKPKFEKNEPRDLYSKYLMIHCMLAKYRKLEVDSKTVLGDSEFIQQIIASQFVSIMGKSEKNKQVAVLLSKESKYRSTAHFSKLVTLLTTEHKLTEKDIIIFVTESPVNIYIRKHVQASPIKIYICMYKNFECEIPMHQAVPHHRIMSEEEASVVLSKLKISEHALKTIFEDDVMGIWLGAVPGQKIEIKNPSEICGVAYDYRLVKPASLRTDAKEIKVSRKAEEREEDSESDSEEKKGKSAPSAPAPEEAAVSSSDSESEEPEEDTEDAGTSEDIPEEPEESSEEEA